MYEGRLLIYDYRTKRSKGSLRNSINSAEAHIDEICELTSQSIKLDTSTIQMQDNTNEELPKKYSNSIYYYLEDIKQLDTMPFDHFSTIQYSITFTFTETKHFVNSVCMGWDGRCIVCGKDENRVKL